MGNNENMLPQEKEKKGTKKGIAGPGDIGGGLAIGFGTLCFCFWANAMGFCDTEGFELAIGVVLLGFFVIYLVGGLYYLRLGNTLSGCVYVVFATSFGLFGGAVNVGHALCSYSGIPFDNTIGGISFLISGTFVLFLLPGLRYSAKLDFLVFFFAGIGVSASGLSGLGIMTVMTGMLSGWALLFSGICVYYSAVAGVLKTTGIDVPCGRPFFKQKTVDG